MSSAAVLALRALRQALFRLRGATGPRSIADGRRDHRRNARRARALLGVPGRARRSRRPAGLWFLPAGREAPPDPGEPCILYLHGGGYVMGSPGSHALAAARLARAAERPVLAARYRLAPEHPFPAALDDARRALESLATDRDPTRIALFGESAGGGLAIATLLECGRCGGPTVGSLVCFAPWVRLAGPSGRLGPWARAYAGDADPSDPRISPLLGPVDGLPPTQIHVGGADVLADEGEALHERLRAAGVTAELRRWPGAFHGFHHYPVPEAGRALRAAAAFIAGDHRA